MKLAACIAVVLFSTSGFSAPSYAIRFSEDPQAVVVPDDDELDLPREFTVEAWVRPSKEIRNQAFKYILSKNFGGTGYALVMIGLGDEERIQFESNDLYSFGLSNGYNERAFRDQWIHVAGVATDKQLQIFVNGIWVGGAERNSDIVANVLPLRIGGSPWASFRGDIDEVRIWNKVRSHADIVQMMHRQLSGNEDGLVANWRFDEGRGTVAHNNGSSELDGILGGAWTAPIKNDFWVTGPGGTLPKWVPGVELAKSWTEIAKSSPFAKIEVNGKPVVFLDTMRPRVVNGTLYAGQCTISDQIGIKVMGVQTLFPRRESYLSADKPGFSMLMPIGSHQATLNGSALDMDAPPIQLGEISCFPVRWFITQYGGSIEWDNARNTAKITIPAQTSSP